MEYIIGFQLNIYGTLVMLLLFFIIKYRLKVPTFRKSILLHLTFFTIVALILEPISWIFDGLAVPGGFIVGYLSNFLIILLAPVIAGFFMVYVDYFIFKSKIRIRKRIYYMHPTILTFILLIINIFHPIYFSVSTDTNVYVGGNFIWVQYVLLSLAYVYLLIYIAVYNNKIEKYVRNIFAFFLLVPILGMIIQVLITSVFFAWTSIAFSIFVMYVFLESTSGAIDYLTKLYSRQSYESYMDLLMENNISFGVLYLDLNSFKEINDTFGHIIGDKVLIEFGNLLKKALSPNKMIARLGGDEFISVLENSLDIDKAILKLKASLKSSALELVRNLTFSYGYSEFSERVPIDKIYYVVDREMYQFKRLHHEKIDR